MGDILDFDKDEPFSISAWVKATLGATQAIVTKEENGGDFEGYNFILDAAGALTFFLVHDIAPADYIAVFSSEKVVDEVWAHVMVTYDGSITAAGVLLYKDGLNLTENTISDTLTDTTVNAAPLNIGARDNRLG